MEKVFLEILNRSITAGLLILAVLIFRVLLRKAPKWINCLLWAMVAVRLLCPFSVESILSLVPSAEPIPQNIMTEREPELYTGIPALNQVVNPILSENFQPTPEDSVNPLQVYVYVAAMVWIAGMVLLLLYAAVSFFSLHRRVRASIVWKENIRLCDDISTPFILGIFRPIIYIPSGAGEIGVNGMEIKGIGTGEIGAEGAGAGRMEAGGIGAEGAGAGRIEFEEPRIAHIIAHERAHLKRKDHWWKPLGFLTLTIYWFHPLVWAAYFLFCRDIELACDEKVICGLERKDSISYSETLLAYSIDRRNILACPLAFGEVGVKERIKHVLSYKKPAFWLVAVAVVSSAVLAICFLTDPPKEKDKGTFSKEMAASVNTKGKFISDSSKQSGGAGLPGGETARNGGVELPGGERAQNGGAELPGGETAQNGGVELPGGETAQNGGVELPGGETAQNGGVEFPGGETAQNGGAGASGSGDSQNQQVELPDKNGQNKMPEFEENASRGETAPQEYMLVYQVEGMTEEEPAELVTGDGYVLLLPKEGWIMYAPEAWCFELDSRVQFWVARISESDFPGLDREAMEQHLTELGFHKNPESDLFEKTENGLTIKTKIKTNGAEAAWFLSYAYPQEAEEGWGSRLRTIIQNFGITAGTEQELTTEEKAAKEMILSFAKAYLAQDEQAVKQYLGKDVEAVFSGETAGEALIKRVTGVGTLRNIVSKKAQYGEINVIYQISGEDYERNLLVGVEYPQGEWKVAWYGLDA